MGVAVDLELSDGWYCIKTSVDDALKALIETGKIFVGMKLSIHGAKVYLNWNC